jgi:hypothetical protein
MMRIRGSDGKSDRQSNNLSSFKKLLSFVTRRKRPESDHVHPASQPVGSYFLSRSQQEQLRQSRGGPGNGCSSLKGGGSNLRSNSSDISSAVEKISLVDGKSVPTSRGIGNRMTSKSGNAVVVVEPLQRSSLTTGAARMTGSSAEVLQQRPPTYTPGREPPSSSGGSGKGGVKAGAEKTGGGGQEKEKPLCCDKCDGKHETDNCPYYKKQRESHPDAQKNGWKKIGGTSSLPGAMLRNARVVRQPGDGSCLFHSMSYGLKDGSTASTLRAEICSYIDKNPSTPICETPLSDWVKWDSGVTCREYGRKMSRGAWGGGIEMACASLLKGVNVHVYERVGGGFKRISAFDHPSRPESRKTVRVLYCGGVHYGAYVCTLRCLYR